MERHGVEVKCGAPAPSVEELKKLGYTHILIATGAWQAGKLDIPGNVKGVIGWMKEMKTQVKPCLTGHVVVVGAGNTATSTSSSLPSTRASPWLSLPLPLRRKTAS